MRVATQTLLGAAQAGRYAIGAFNVYNLEGVKAVISAAEAENSPVMLQLHPKAVEYGGLPLQQLCLSAADSARVPVAVHLDHSSSAQAIAQALEAGLSSVMADGSHLPYEENVAFTRQMTEQAHQAGAAVEAELGRLTGTEDGLTVPEYEAKLTGPDQALDFIAQTGVDCIAVCIGNVHGVYRTPPRLDFARLAAIRERVTVPLVLHGASGLSEDDIKKSIALGICKFNVNTEVRQAYVNSLKASLSAANTPDLLVLMDNAVAAMSEVVAEKLRLFGSVGRV